VDSSLPKIAFLIAISSRPSIWFFDRTRAESVGNPARLPLRVKNRPDAIEMGCLRYPRKQTSANAAAMSDTDPNPFADCDVIVCYGKAKPERQADPARADEAANASLVERADRLCMTARRKAAVDRISSR
jgi:hypothetical protein